ncbi:MAG: hypothetical protein K2J72_08730, partial [Oscillospiraceae bacterium]|nr:hypothetical protein [Oscillospiraceae bacterium]
MSPKTQQMVELYEMLPEQEQELAFETVKRVVLECQPDFTKVPPDERIKIDEAEKSGFISEDEIDWD